MVGSASALCAKKSNLARSGTSGLIASNFPNFIFRWIADSAHIINSNRLTGHHMPISVHWDNRASQHSSAVSNELRCECANVINAGQALLGSLRRRLKQAKGSSKPFLLIQGAALNEAVVSEDAERRERRKKVVVTASEYSHAPDRADSYRDKRCNYIPQAK